MIHEDIHNMEYFILKQLEVLVWLWLALSGVAYESFFFRKDYDQESMMVKYVD